MAGFLLNVVVAFFLSPFVVHSLGDKIYGIWTLVVSLKGYYGLLDLGIRSAVGQYVTRYYAQNEIEALNRTMNTALAIMGGVAVLITLVSGIIAWGAPQWFNLEYGNIMILRLTIIITGITMALTFPAAVFGISMYASQRFDLQNLVAGLERILMAGATVFVLKAGFGILGLAIVGFVTTLMAGIANVIFAFRLLRGFRISSQFISKASLRELSHYGFFMAFINIAGRIVTNLDAIVIGVFMTAEDITYYAIGANLIPYYFALVSSVTLTITPHATSLDAQGKKERLRSLWLKSSRGIIMFASLIAAGLVFVGKDFLKIWMGERYVAGIANVSSADILKILAIAALMRLGASAGKQMCFAMRRVQFLALLAFIDACLNVLLSCLLVQKFGLIGVAVGTLVPMALIYGIVLPGFMMKILDVKITEYIARVPWGGLSILAAMFFMSSFFNQHFPVESWPDFAAKALIFTVPSVVTGIIIGTTQEEKQFLMKTLRNLGVAP